MFITYRNGDSHIHVLDPRAKLLMIAVTGILVYLSEPPELVMLSFIVLLLADVADIPIFKLLEGLRPMLLFFAAIFLAHLLFTPGYAGIFVGGITVARFALLILFATILIHTTSPSELNMALMYFMRPLGTIGTNIAFMVSVAIALIPELLLDRETIARAQAARGYKPMGVKGLIVLMVPLLRRSFRKADELSDALESRCYHQDREHYYYGGALTRKDCVSAVIFMAVLILVCV